jgi:2-isopropylmalate synthase
VGRALAQLGVDVIEAGFPSASRNDWDCVNAIAGEIRGPIICALAICNRNSIQLAAAAVRAAPRRRVHIFLPTSDLPYNTSLTAEEIVRGAIDGVQAARDSCEDVAFTLEDSARMEPDFLAEVVEAVIEAGAITVNITDSVGYIVPEEISELFRYLRRTVRDVSRITLSIQCCNELGMAVANSLSAVLAGARQVECAISGIGARSGSCSLKEIAMALRMRQSFFNVYTNLQLSRLHSVCNLVAGIAEGSTVSGSLERAADAPRCISQLTCDRPLQA